jgi:hypothetical protein
MLSAGGSAQSGLLVPSALLPGWLCDVLREHGFVTAGPNGQVAIEVCNMYKVVNLTILSSVSAFV